MLQPVRYASVGLGILAAAVGVVLPPAHATADSVVAANGVVATVNPIASEAGLQVLREGGNAVDAAVAAALTLSVVDGYNSGIGGGCLILIRTADGKLHAIDGREMAPAAATPDMYVVEGKANPELSQTGALAVGVPGSLAAYKKAIELGGSQPLERLLRPGYEAARDGFRIDRVYASALRSQRKKLRSFPASRAIFFRDGGKEVAQEGDLLVQEDLAATYDHLRREGIDHFYRGAFAAKVGQWMQENGGIVTAEDFAQYEVKLREVVVTTYRNYQIVGFPPPSSGGLHVAQTLNILETFPLGSIHRESPVRATHLVAEAFSRAFADRAYWLGDSDFVPVPRGIIDKEYARELAEEIDPERVVPVEKQGTPPEWKQDVYGRHTTHIAAADAAGNWVAITATVNTQFGSKVIVPGTGVILNNQMDDFSIQPGVPNAFGLVGGEQNAVEPGKRPLSSMSPTLVLDKEGEPVLTIGAAGGPKIITQVLLGVIRVVDFGQSLEEAVAGPRFHHQWRPNKLGVEEEMPAEMVEELERMGHKTYKLPAAGVTQAIGRDTSGKLIGVTDPRVPGKAAGY